MPTASLRKLLDYIVSNSDTWMDIENNKIVGKAVGAVCEWYVSGIKRPNPNDWREFWTFMYKITTEEYSALRLYLYNVHAIWLREYRSIQQRNTLTTQFNLHRDNLKKLYPSVHE